MKYSYIFLLCIIFSFTAFFNINAQENVNFHASTVAREILEETDFLVRYTFSGGKPSDFKAPNFSGFAQLGEPSVRKSVSIQNHIVNGTLSQKTNEEYEYYYRLKPTKTGNITIEPAMIMVDGKLLKSNAITIKVIPSASKKSTPSKANGEYFFKLSLSDKTSYIGQQVLVEYKLYTRYQDTQFDLIALGDFPNIPLEELTDNALNIFGQATKSYLEVIDGVQYQAIVVKQLIATPEKVGIFTFPAAQVVVNIPDKIVQRGFFSERTFKREVLNASTAELIVKDFPSADQPKDFNGLVGNVMMDAIVTPTKMTTDDGFTVRLTIESDMSEKRILPQPVYLGDAFEILDPVVSSFTYQKEDKTWTKKTFDYLVFPKKTGTFKIVPSLVVFDNQTNSYNRLESDTVSIEVEKGINPDARADNRNSELLSKNPSPYKERCNYKKPWTFGGSWLFWALFSIPFIAIGGCFYYKFKPTTKKEKSVSPFDQYRSNIANVDSIFQAGKYKESIHQTHQSVIKYLAAITDIPMGLINKNEIIEALELKNIDPILLKDLRELLTRCEEQMYSPFIDSSISKEIQTRANEMIGLLNSKIHSS